MAKITPAEAYIELMKLINTGAPNSKIATVAFELHNMLDQYSQEQYFAIYDLSLLEEPGMDLEQEEILKLINQLKT